MILIAVGDHTCYIKCDEGFNVFKLKNYVMDNKKFKKKYISGSEITRDELFSTDCEIKIPAAMELQICKNEAQNVKYKLNIEGANGQLI